MTRSLSLAVAAFIAALASAPLTAHAQFAPGGVGHNAQAALDALSDYGQTTAGNTGDASGYLSSLVAAAAVTPATSSVTGACKVVLNHPGQFLGATGIGSASAHIFILDLAAVPSTPYTVLAGDLLTAPVPVAADGTWQAPALVPISATAGVVMCASSSLYSGGVLTLTPVTSTAATENASVAYAR